METIAKLTFVRVVTIIETAGAVYHAQQVGPGNWRQARGGYYPKGFKQGGMGAQLNLVYLGYIHRDSNDEIINKHAKDIVEIAHESWVTGDTALYGGNAGSAWVFAQDFPEVIAGRIVMNQDTLVARLEAPGKRIIDDNLHISADGQVRAMKRENFRIGNYTIGQMLESNQPIFLTGDEQAPRQMANIMHVTGKLGCLSIPSQGDISVPVLGEMADKLCLDGDWKDFYPNTYSFGIRHKCSPLQRRALIGLPLRVRDFKIRNS